MCTLNNSKHRRSWLVQLATRTKEKVSEVVRECPLVMNGQVTYKDMNVLPPGSYDNLIGIDWLEAHREKGLIVTTRPFACLDEEGNLRFVKGILKVISSRHISTMQLKKFCGKSCRVYATHVLEVAKNEDPR